MIAEETAEYWIGKGYSKTEAEKIAAWCKANQMTPTPDTIKIIIAQAKVPFRVEPYNYAELLSHPVIAEVERSFKAGKITEDQAISVLMKLGYTALDGRTFCAKWRREITPPPAVKPDPAKTDAAIAEMEKIPGWQTRDIDGFTIAHQKSTNPGNQATTRDESERMGWTTYSMYTYVYAGWQTVYAWAGWKKKVVITPPVIAEETKEFWISMGYKEADAIKIAEWCKANQMTPTPEKIKEIVAPVIIYAAIIPPEFVMATGAAVAKGLGDVWDTLAGGIVNLAEGFGKGVDYVVEHIDEIAIDAIITGLSFAAIEALFVKIAAAYPAASTAVTALSKSAVTAPAAVMTTKQIAAALIKNPKNSIELLKGLSKTKFNNVFAELQSTAAGRTAERTVYTEYLKVIEKESGVKGIAQFFGEHWRMAIGGAGLLMGMGFAVPWGAKEWIWESLTINFADAIRKQDWELAEKYLPDVKEVRDKTKAVINMASWLNPISYGMYQDGIKSMDTDIKLWEEQIAAGKGIIVGLPELVYTYVRDIVDGDTIEVSMEARNAVTGEEIKLPEYEKTAHARVRIVGINTPEKSPKGEILCTGIEIFKVEPTYADQARNRLLPLNDREVTLKIDPANMADGYGRLLAVVEYIGTDIGLRQIKEGMACYYYREPHKYVNDKLYEDETTKAAAAGIGMWTAVTVTPAGEVVVAPEFKISIDSSPTNGKLYIDNVYTNHLTPSNETELKDVMTLLKPGRHKIKVTKANMQAEKEVDIIAGDNGTILLTLEIPGLPPPEVVPEVVPEVIPEVVPKIEFKISIDSNPSNAKLYVDNVYTHHLTPSNEKELKDVMRLFTLGKHIIKVTKSNLMAEKEVEIIEGDNGSIMLDLVVPGLPAVIPKVIPEVVTPPVVVLTTEQKAGVRILLDVIATYTAGGKVLTEKERLELVLKYLGG